MAWYKKDMSFADPSNAKYFGGVGKAIAGAGKAAFKLGDDKQKQTNITNDLQFKKDEATRKQTNLDNKLLQEENIKKANISAYKKLHPKTTAGLSDEEIYALGSKITAIHNDNTKMKFSDSYTDSNNNRIGVFTTGKKDKDGKPVYKTINFGQVKVKDSSNSPSFDDINSKENQDKLFKKAKELKNQRLNKGIDDFEINF